MRRTTPIALLTAVLLALPTAAAAGPDRPPADYDGSRPQRWSAASGHVTHRVIQFPVAGPVSYHDDFGDPRSGGRTHAGNDLMGSKLQHLLATVDGTVVWTRVDAGELSGNMLGLRDDEGWTYLYIHINNDTPGTDDGANPPEWIFAPGIEEGSRVRAGDHIAYMGDSGNAEWTSPHVHFEIRDPDGNSIDPYASLVLSSGFSAHDGSTRAGEVSTADVTGDAHAEVLITSGAHAPPVLTAMTTDGTTLWTRPVFNPAARGGVRLDTATDTDGCSWIAVGAGPGGGPHVKVFRTCDGGELERLASFYSYGSRMKSGTDVALGDLDGDGLLDLVTAPLDGGPHVKVWRGDGSGRFAVTYAFMAYPADTPGGARVEVGDIQDAEGTPRPRLVVVPGPGGPAKVRVMAIDGRSRTVEREWNALPWFFHGGAELDVADLVGDVAGDEIVTGSGPGGSADVIVRAPWGRTLRQWRTHDGTNGVAVAAGDVEAGGTAEVVALTGPGRPMHVRLYPVG